MLIGSLVPFFPELKRRTYISAPSAFTSGRGTGTGPFTRAEIISTGVEEIVSQCHAGSWPRDIDTDRDIGGLMSLTRTATIGRFGGTVTWTNPNSKVERGSKVHAGNLTGFNPTLDASLAGTDVLNAFGTSAVARVLPTNPASNMAQAVAELRRDGLPSLPGSNLRERVDISRRAGSEYLNVEFGWLPLVSDLQDFARAVRNSRQLIEQYIRDSDHKIRRRYVRPTDITSRVTTGGGYVLPTVSGWVSQGSVTEMLTTDMWFSGAFRYHVPVDSDFMHRLLRYESFVNHLFGTRITPELVWELAPWSWAVDWFTNVGDVIHNISLLGVDGLVMQYGYAMRHQRCVADYRMTTVATSSEQGGLYCGKTVLKETKQRIRANPYGFGIDDVSLSARQLAVLAALGLSQGRRND